MPAKSTARKPRKPAARKPRTDPKPSRAAALEDIVLKLARGETSAAKDAAEAYVVAGS